MVGAWSSNQVLWWRYSGGLMKKGLDLIRGKEAAISQCYITTTMHCDEKIQYDGTGFHQDV